MSILASPRPVEPDTVITEKENNETYETPVYSKAGRNLRPRNKKAFHPPATSSVLSTQRVKSPYQRPRRATVRPKTHPKKLARDETDPDLDLIDLDKLQNMCIIQKKAMSQSDAHDATKATPDNMKGRRKPPPASLTIDGFRPQPVFIQAVPVPVPQDQGPVYPGLGYGSIMSFPSMPSLSHSVSIGSNSTVIQNGPRMGKMQVPLRLPRPPIPEVQQVDLCQSDLMATGVCPRSITIIIPLLMMFFLYSRLERSETA
jgi:hypothetical protein